MRVRGGEPDDLAPAFYAAPRFVRNQRLREWWTLLHPPYTSCHLSFVVIGACIKGPVSASRLIVTLVAFFFAVGIGAHALDELHDRPLSTAIPSWQLAIASIAGIGVACALGVVGVFYVNTALVYFIVAGVLLAVAYNLELLHGLLHNDLTFAIGWGAFPALTSYFSQHQSLNITAVATALFTSLVALTQRQLSTPARLLRRSAVAFEGDITWRDGHRSELSRAMLLAPLERALSLLCWASIVLALSLACARFFVHI